FDAAENTKRTSSALKTPVAPWAKSKMENLSPTPSHGTTGLDILKLLARFDPRHAPLVTDESPEVRVALAGAKALPPDIVQTLATDSDPRVRAALARNLCCPLAVLAKLAADPDAGVREAV